MSQGGSGILTSRGPSVVRFEVDVPSLYVKRVSLGTDHELSMATFGVHPQDRNGGHLRIENVWSIVKKGQRVKVTTQMGQSAKQTLFHGWITEAQTRAGGKNEDIEYTAMGLDWGLKVEKLFGAWCWDYSRSLATWLRATQPCFNKDGKYNKHTKDVADRHGDARVVFDLDDSVFNPTSAWWNAADMVRYCVSAERKGDLSDAEGRLFKTTDKPGSELADFRPLDVNVEGEDIWTALCKIAARCSHGVRIKYAEDRAKVSLVFFTKKLDEAAEKKQFEIPAATLTAVVVKDYGKLLASLDVQHDLSGIVRQVDAITPPKLYDDVFQLHSGWTKAAENAAFGEGDTGAKIANFLKETDPETSSDWPKFKYVGRRFILNETGRDEDCSTVGEANGSDGSSPSAGSDGKPYDFTQHFGDDEWGVRLRPFRHHLAERDASGATLPVLVHADFGAPLLVDAKLGHDVELLSDRAGIYFRGRPLIAIARAFQEDNIAYIFPTAVSVEACVEGDQDSPHDVHGVLGAEDMPVPTFGVIRLDDGLREDNVNGDTQARQKAQKLCDDAVGELKSPRLVGTATIPWASFQFNPGDVIDKINGRNLKVSAQVAKVTWDAMDQTTEIALHYPSIDTQTHSRQHQQRPEEHWTHAGSPRQQRFMQDVIAENEAAGRPIPDMVLADVAGLPMGEGEAYLKKFLKDPLGAMLGGPTGGRDLGLDESMEPDDVKKELAGMRAEDKEERAKAASEKRIARFAKKLEDGTLGGKP